MVENGKVIGRFYHRVVKLLFRLPVRDTDCDFRLFRRRDLGRRFFKPLNLDLRLCWAIRQWNVARLRQHHSPITLDQHLRRRFRSRGRRCVESSSAGEAGIEHFETQKADAMD